MTRLDDALAMHAIAPGEWRAHADPCCAGTGVMFGGWLAAMLLRAVLADERAHGRPIAFTAHMMRPIPIGADVTLRARPIDGGRSLTTWRTEISEAAGEHVAAFATIVLAEHRESDTFSEFVMPEAPDPSTLARMPARMPFGEHLETLPVKGLPPFNQGSTHAIAWRRHPDGRGLDYAQLAYLCDAVPPPIYFSSAAPRPNSTVTMSIYFFAALQELEAIGDDYILSESNGTRGVASVAGTQVRLWSRQGALLATSEQLGWFK